MDSPSPSRPRPKVGAGIEGTFAPQSGLDTLAATGHYDGDRWRRDLALVRELGLTEVRYPVAWHRVERVPGEHDWRHTDGVVAAASELGVDLIADPLHHTSYPTWLAGGLADPRFPSAYAAFVEAFARRYPAVAAYAPFNEPTCTLDFCHARAFWHPYQASDRDYVRALLTAARGVAEATRRLRALDPGVRIIHVDTFEHHAALDDASRPRADLLNERRFLFEELVRGRVDDAHSLAGYLRAHGATEGDLAAFHRDPIEIDARFGNYYPLNEEQLLEGRTAHAPSREPLGLAALVAQYAARCPYPLSLGETNIQGSVYDRITWLKYVLEQVELAWERHGVPLHDVVWYPLFDCAGWRVLLQGERWPRDPQGLYWCDDATWERHPSALTDAYAALARGATSRDLPAYRLAPSHDATLGPLMSTVTGWAWQDPPDPTLGR